MNMCDCTALALVAFVSLCSAWADTTPVAAPAARAVVPGVWLIPGSVRSDRQPDGNSVVFDAPDGLVVVDTGRHPWHRDAILALAGTRKSSVVAIVNTHWHLDHVSGNPALRSAYPDLRVYASDAIDGALKGFLATSAQESVGYLDDPQLPATIREDIRADVATIRNGAALRPDVVISASAVMNIGGRKLGIRLATHAVTAGDVWLYDERDGLAVLGDLVTLPAPFLDTACPEGWQAALERIEATPFEIAIPGHGSPMTRAQFRVYRGAFEAFVDCSNSRRPASECASGWADSVEPLLADDPGGKPRARETAEYYVGVLRAGGGRSNYCSQAPAEPLAN